MEKIYTNIEKNLQGFRGTVNWSFPDLKIKKNNFKHALARIRFCLFRIVRNR